MKLYIPVYDRGWKIDTVDSEDVRILYHRVETGSNAICRWKERVGFYGPIYDDNHIFTSEEDAWKWINKDYSVADKVYTNFKKVER